MVLNAPLTFKMAAINAPSELTITTPVVQAGVERLPTPDSNIKEGLFKSYATGWKKESADPIKEGNGMTEEAEDEDIGEEVNMERSGTQERETRRTDGVGLEGRENCSRSNIFLLWLLRLRTRQILMPCGGSILEVIGWCAGAKERLLEKRRECI
ncbi:hypothetical protein NDU88_006191 [Pleurodeles waltl]|uniref:Uncharacterized protein n=1 Tax=Pleurodeles waltl TaxID=8319 RepID=A0AAV7TEF1_PLEWA|nr:hypothetical protein NDU88_006191 [Pleurodeles waltl]